MTKLYLKGLFIIALASLGIQAVSAQEDTDVKQDAILQLMNDSAYWASLDEVVVKSTIPKTRLKGDAMRTTVSGSILEKAGSSTDVLNKIPTLKAEKGEGVSVFGRGNAEVYINGRKLQDNNELDRLRSEDILHIDVIHNPGARYSSSTKAVVRIYTKKPQGEGFSFVDNIGTIYRYGWAATNDLNINYRTGGLDLTASLVTNYYGHTRGNSSNDISYQVGNDYYIGHSTQDSKALRKELIPQLQLNYMLNENHSFGAYYKWTNHLANSDGWFQMLNARNNQITEIMNSDILSDNNAKKHIFNTYYNGRIGNLSIDWNLDGLFNNNLNDNTTTETVIDNFNLDYNNIRETGLPFGRTSDPNTVLTSTLNNNNFIATKLILTYPIWKGNLTAGTEYVHNNRLDTYHINTNNTGAVQASDIEIDESSISGFIEYGRMFGPTYIQLGLRYEHLQNDYYNFGMRQDEVCRKYGDWFPSITLAYPMKKGVQLSLAYRKEIERPSYNNLSSSELYINKYTYQSGNPYLLPIYFHNLTFSTAYKWMNLIFTYQHIIDDVVLLSMPYPNSTDPMISLISPQNSEHPYDRLAITAVARPTIGVWHPMWSANVMFQNYRTLTIDGSLKTLNRPFLQLVWNNDFALPKDWRITINMALTNKGDYMTYSFSKPTLYNSINIQKDIKTQRLGNFTFDLRCYDPFHLAEQQLISYGLRQITAISPTKRMFSLDITWRFNEANKKYKGTGAGKSQKNRI